MWTLRSGSLMFSTKLWSRKANQKTMTSPSLVSRTPATSWLRSLDRSILSIHAHTIAVLSMVVLLVDTPASPVATFHPFRMALHLNSVTSVKVSKAASRRMMKILTQIVLTSKVLIKSTNTLTRLAVLVGWLMILIASSQMATNHYQLMRFYMIRTVTSLPRKTVKYLKNQKAHWPWHNGLSSERVLSFFSWVAS